MGAATTEQVKPLSKNTILRDEVNNWQVKMAKQGPKMGLKNVKGGANPATSLLGG